MICVSPAGSCTHSLYRHASPPPRPNKSLGDLVNTQGLIPQSRVGPVLSSGRLNAKASAVNLSIMGSNQMMFLKLKAATPSLDTPSWVPVASARSPARCIPLNSPVVSAAFPIACLHCSLCLPSNLSVLLGSSTQCRLQETSPDPPPLTLGSQWGLKGTNEHYGSVSSITASQCTCSPAIFSPAPKRT